MRLLHTALLGALITSGHSALAAPSKERDKTPMVFVEKVAATDLYDLLMYPARLNPKINATLLSDVDGVVSSIQAPLGRTVKKKQTVMTVTNTDPVYNYAPMHVTAPVSGVVSSVEVSEGSHVARGQRLATITDPKEIRISMEVTAGDLNSLHTGMQGELKVASQEETVPVKILGISPFVDPASGTASAELGLVKTKNVLPLFPGVVGTVTFRANEHKGIEIPEFALVYRGQESFVRVVDKGVARYQPVTVGNARRGSIEILKGLSAGATLVVRSNTYVGDGEAVNVQKQDTPGRE